MANIPSLLSHLFFLFLQCSKTIAQTPGPAPSGPTNITNILEKAGQYSTLIRLCQTTQLCEQINTQLNNSNQGLTVFAPTDNAFSTLKPGTLNSLTDQQKVALLQFHVLPNYLTISQFQTVSNPLRTQAGDSSNGAFPLNVTTMGNQVNISTGINNATVDNAVYSDGQLVVYQVDSVLLPLSLFGSPSPASAPVGAKKPGSSDSSVGSGDDAPARASGVVGLGCSLESMIALAIAMFGILHCL